MHKNTKNNNITKQWLANIEKCSN